MGCFDSVLIKCPVCRKEIELQSKAGDCSCTVYPQNKVPRVVAVDLAMQIVNCDHCTAALLIKVNAPEILKLRAVIYSADEDYDGCF